MTPFDGKKWSAFLMVTIQCGDPSGALGRPTRLCITVKPSYSPVDVGALREIRKVMLNFGAEQELPVSWGGFKQSN